MILTEECASFWAPYPKGNGLIAFAGHFMLMQAAADAREDSGE